MHFAGEHAEYLRPYMGTDGADNPSLGHLTRSGLFARIGPSDVGLSVLCSSSLFTHLQSLMIVGETDICVVPGRPSIPLSDVSDAVASVSRQTLRIATLPLDHPQGMRTCVVTFVARRAAIGADAGLPALSDEDLPLAPAPPTLAASSFFSTNHRSGIVLVEYNPRRVL